MDKAKEANDAEFNWSKEKSATTKPDQMRKSTTQAIHSKAFEIPSPTRATIPNMRKTQIVRTETAKPTALTEAISTRYDEGPSPNMGGCTKREAMVLSSSDQSSPNGATLLRLPILEWLLEGESLF